MCFENQENQKKEDIDLIYNNRHIEVKSWHSDTVIYTISKDEFILRNESNCLSQDFCVQLNRENNIKWHADLFKMLHLNCFKNIYGMKLKRKNTTQYLLNPIIRFEIWHNVVDFHFCWQILQIFHFYIFLTRKTIKHAKQIQSKLTSL